MKRARRAMTTSAAAAGRRTISGTIRGVDGRCVNALVSLVHRNRAGQPVRIDGSVNPA